MNTRVFGLTLYSDYASIVLSSPSQRSRSSLAHRLSECMKEKRLS